MRQKGAEKKVSAIKKKQKELILRLRQERAHLQCMQEAYRSTSEKHHSFLKDKKKLLKEPSLLAFELLSSKLLNYIVYIFFILGNFFHKSFIWLVIFY